MAFGPKSAQRRARVSREIKRFAQRNATKGRKELVERTGASMFALAMNTLVSAPPDAIVDKGELLEAITTNTRRIFAQRGLSKRARVEVLGAALAVVKPAF